MKISNKTSLKSLDNLIRELTKKAKLKKTRNLFVSVKTRPYTDNFNGGAYPCILRLHKGYKDMTKAFNKPLNEWISLDGKITMSCPQFYYVDSIAWIEKFVSIFIHELGHVWDEQHHGTSHWDRHNIPWEYRKQESIAQRYATKYQEKKVDINIQNLMLDVALEIETKQIRRKQKLGIT